MDQAWEESSDLLALHDVAKCFTVLLEQATPVKHTPFTNTSLAKDWAINNQEFEV